MTPEGRSADEIVKNQLHNVSSWHFFQAVSWLDYAKRNHTPSAFHYAAFELRYGIEYLLFELLVLGNRSLSEEEYRSCIGKPRVMKKALKSSRVEYDKLVEFTRILWSLTHGVPKLRFWKLEELFRYWGIASEVLHFVGAHSMTYAKKEWCDKTLARLEQIVLPIWDIVQSTRGFGLLDKATMEPEVRDAWLKFSKGQLSEESLITRMQIIQPALAARRKPLIIQAG